MDLTFALLLLKPYFCFDQEKRWAMNKDFNKFNLTVIINIDAELILISTPMQSIINILINNQTINQKFMKMNDHTKPGENHEIEIGFY